MGSRDSSTRTTDAGPLGEASTQPDAHPLGEAPTQEQSHAGAGEQSTEAGTESTFSEGDKLDRFLVLECLGAGGMGVVYSAYDPKLDRRVAIKILRAPAHRDKDAPPLRLLREAQAMARLSHPNVVTVFEVAEVRGRMFVAMEHVDGQTLRSWLAAEPRSWHEVLELYCQAGAGLVAAHDAGLVHRDFKPDNVLVGSDGRPRVTDFGLVGIGDELDPTDEETSPSTVDTLTTPATGSPLATPLTEAGAFLGTPRYMAPEQLAGRGSTAASDQFSYCVSLYEALYGEHPFHDHGAAALDEARSRRLREAPPGTGVPPKLRHALERGLATNPDERFGSVRELVAKLAATTQRRRPSRMHYVLGAALFAAGLAGILIAWPAAETPRLCEGADDKLRGVWDDEVKHSVAAAFRATDRPFSESNFQRLDQALSGRAELWMSIYTETCRATHIRGEQSEQLLDRRMGCLSRALGETRALTRILIEMADAELVDRALQAVYALSRIESCASIDELTTTLPPLPAARAARVDELRAHTDRARALRLAGKYRAGADAMHKVVAEARAIDYPPFTAESLHELSQSQIQLDENQRALTNLRAATQAAARAQDDALLAEIAARQIHALGYKMGRHSAALDIAPMAEAALLRAGSPARARIELDVSMGALHLNMGSYAKARHHFERCLSITKSELGIDHPDVARFHNNIGIALQVQGDQVAARTHLQRALALWQERLGPDHPQVALAHNNLGLTFVNEDDYRQGGVHYQRALTIWHSAFGEDHTDVAMALGNLADTHSRAGDLVKAEEYLRRALAIQEKLLGHDHYLVGSSLSSLGAVRLKRGSVDDAARLYQRALPVTRAALGENHELVLDPIIGMAEVWLIRGHPDRARPLLEQALDHDRAELLPPRRRNDARFALARALWRTGGSRESALALAREAEASTENAQERREITAWIDERDAPD